jgi:predicted MPP superfamily phosphohydrolase
MLKLLMRWKIFFIIIVSLFSIYSFWYCPNDLEITHHFKTFGEGQKQLKIAHVTDLHSKGMGTVEQKLFDSLKSENPDIIFFTGDLATPGGSIAGYKSVIENLKAPLGVYFVKGNWEYWEPISELSKLLKTEKVTDLSNKRITLNNKIDLIGFDDIEGSPDLSLRDKIDPNKLNIALFHSPSFFRSIPSSISLSFAGHSHGGQVKIPFLGSIWTPRGTGKYREGWFKEGAKELYVSRGIGNSILPLRFNCRPELAIITLKY